MIKIKTHVFVSCSSLFDISVASKRGSIVGRRVFKLTTSEANGFWLKTAFVLVELMVRWLKFKRFVAVVFFTS